MFLLLLLSVIFPIIICLEESVYNNTFIILQENLPPIDDKSEHVIGIFTEDGYLHENPDVKLHPDYQNGNRSIFDHFVKFGLIENRQLVIRSENDSNLLFKGKFYPYSYFRLNGIHARSATMSWSHFVNIGQGRGYRIELFNSSELPLPKDSHLKNTKISGSLQSFHHSTSLLGGAPRARVLVVTHPWGGGTALFEDELMGGVGSGGRGAEMIKHFSFVFARVYFYPTIRTNKNVRIRLMLDSKNEVQLII
jgi:hypothetical protein